MAEVQAEDVELAVFGADVGEIADLERLVRAAGPRDALHQRVQAAQRLVQHPALFHLAAGQERRALGEEVQDVQAAQLQQPLVQLGGVRRELPGDVRGRGPQLPGELPVAQPHRLDILHVEVAEGEERRRQRFGDRLALLGADGRFVRIRVQRVPHQFPCHLPHVELGEGALLAPPAHQRGHPHRPVHQPGPRALAHEEPGDERARDGGRDARGGAEACGIHGGPRTDDG